MVFGDTSFEDNIRKTMLTEISEIELNHLNDYALAQQDTLKTIYGNGILDDESIDKALEKVMLIQMWNDFRIVSKNLMPLENIPNLIAYGLKIIYFQKNNVN